MPKKTLQCKESVKGGSIDLLGYNGTVPLVAVHELEREAAGIMHGTIMLTLHIKDGNLTRFVTSRERSFIPGKSTTGETVMGQ